jgi:ElaB/YqjD/DUF883 family membrane-anchored ribosome-binding protein
VAADPVVSRELKFLQNELSASQRQRTEAGPAPAAAAVSEMPASAAPAEESAEAKALRGQLRELVKEVTDFIEDAEKNISAHPAMSVVAAMLCGIVIGSLLARRQ